MDDVESVLAEIRARADSGNAAGWWYDEDVPRLLDAVDAVLVLHHPDDAATPFCTECGLAWPCKTYRAITGALTGTGGAS